MEWLFLIGFIWFVIWACSSSDTSSSSNSTSSSPYSPSLAEPFEIRVSFVKKTLCDTSLWVFDVKMRGSITVPVAGAVTTYLTAEDVTDSETKPIVSVHKELQYRDTTFFGVEGSLNLPHRESILQDWATVMVVPVDLLVFPSKGIRKIRFTYTLSNSYKATYTKQYKNSEQGYEDMERDKKLVAEGTVLLALYISAIDNEIHSSEQQMILDWIDKQSYKKELKAEFDSEMEKLTQGDKRDPVPLCKILRERATLAARYSIVELCFQIMSADNVLSEEESELINKLASDLAIPLDKYQAIKEKHLAIHEISNIDVDNIDVVLGITANMAVDKMKVHLRKLYQKWNALTGHEDSSIRAKADKMVDLISQKRSSMN